MKRIICLSILFIGLIFCYNKSIASNIPDGFEKVRCTCYLPTGNKTADGTVPYKGIIASNREHLGDVAVLYDENLRIIGFFECKDTGGHKDLKNGSRIDVFCNSDDEIIKWQKTVGDYVYVQWVKGDG